MFFFCNFLGKLIGLLFQVVTNVWTIMPCVTVPKYPNFPEKSEILQTLSEGEVVSPDLGQVLSLTLFKIRCHITYKQSLQMIVEKASDHGSPRSLLQ